MTTRKSERLMNLLIMLLVARRHLEKEQIRAQLYPGSGDEAFEKMFERDKEELRQLGIPIETASQDAFFDDAVGYRIHREAFELPDIDLEADEAAVIGLAARVWQHAGLAGAASDAIVKLKAAGVAVDRTALDIVEPHLRADEPAFDALWSAAQTRTEVAFDYRRGDSADVSHRRVQPWRVAWSRGRWYVLGLDIDRGEPRLFRLSRIQGTVRPRGRAGAYDLPGDVDLSALTRSLAPGAPTTETAAVLVRSGTCHGLRRAAGATETDVPGPDERTRWDRLSIRGWGRDALADEVLSFGADAFVEAPEELRAAVVGRLTAVVR